MADTVDFKNPDFEPYNGEEFKGTWINIQSRKVEFQTALITGNNSNTGGLILGDLGDTWKFLAPQQIMESINNSWEPWESISSRLAGKGKEFKDMTNEAASIWKALKSQKKGLDIGNAFKGLSSVSKSNIKVDTPLVYENSERREYTLQFNLTAKDQSDSMDMMSSVVSLKSHSLPRRTDDSYGLGIELPYIFRVTSESLDMPFPSGMSMIFLEVAALTSVQPTYMAPYDNYGNPMRIELTCTFKELPPLYKDSLYTTEFGG